MREKKEKVDQSWRRTDQWLPSFKYKGSWLCCYRLWYGCRGYACFKTASLVLSVVWGKRTQLTLTFILKSMVVTPVQPLCQDRPVELTLNWCLNAYLLKKWRYTQERNPEQRNARILNEVKQITCNSRRMTILKKQSTKTSKIFISGKYSKNTSLKTAKMMKSPLIWC